MKRPNVLVFCVDEMRADHLACAGNPIVQTPNLDRLAARGTRFRNACCNNPICMPARATMFTGLLPRDHGLRTNGQSLRTDLPTVAGVLAEAGYRTHSAGKLHLTPWIPAPGTWNAERFPEAAEGWNGGMMREFPVPYYGFQTVDFVGGHGSWCWGPYMEWVRAQGGDPALLSSKSARAPRTGAPECFKMALPQELHFNRFIADSTIRLLESSAGEKKPFFAWCSFPDPHAPLCPPAPYGDLYDPAAMPLPHRREGELDALPPIYREILAGRAHPNGIDNTGITDAHWREMLAMTYGMVTHVDTEIGRVLAALERSGHAENTVIVFITDHGDMMGDHGLIWKAFYTFRGCINIPLIVAAPGMAGGKVSEALVSQIDLMPSLLDLCGVPLPAGSMPDTRAGYPCGETVPLQAFPGRSWRPLLEGRSDSGRDEIVIENDDPTSGYQVRCLVTRTHRLAIFPGTEHGELFDLAKDPWELNNRWYDPAAAGLRSELTARLLDAYSRATPGYPIPYWNA